MSAPGAASRLPRVPAAARSLVLDGALAAVLAVGSAVEVLAQADSIYASTASLPVQLTAVVAAAAPIGLRRRHPFAALTAVIAITAGGRVLLDTPVVLWSLGVILTATYSAARYARHPLQWWSVAPPLALIGVYSLVIPGFFNLNDLEIDIPGIVAAWGVGLILRSWAATRHALRESLAEVQAAEAARTASAIGDERDRIARELHDVVAHCVTVMVVQAGSARLNLRDAPDESEIALRAVEGTGRETLAEMRRMVGLLRADDADELAPQPTLARVDQLVAQFCAAGVGIDFAVEGAPRVLPLGVDVSAYRILQESLTNVVAHAADAHVTARVRYLPAEVQVDVRNGPGRESGGRPGGHGIVGMRERTRLYGGRLDADRTGDGGFRVVATLPAEAEP